MKILICLLSLFFINACSDTTNIKTNAHGLLWVQTAAEFKAIAIQTYNFATERINSALDDKSWTAALEQNDRYSELPPAIMPSIGYIENFRLVPDESSEGDWNVIADIHTTSKDVGDILRGFSFSAIEVIRKVENPEFHIYLPYPLYNDKMFIEQLALSKPNLLIGKWIKKELSSTAIGLIAISVVFVLAPEWDIQYRQIVRPKLIQFMRFVSEFVPKIKK